MSDEARKVCITDLIHTSGRGPEIGCGMIDEIKCSNISWFYVMKTHHMVHRVASKNSLLSMNSSMVAVCIMLNV